MERQVKNGEDVVIYEIASTKVDSIIGVSLKRHDGTGSGRATVELRMQTGRERINDHYGVAAVPTGKYKKGDIISKEDLP